MQASVRCIQHHCIAQSDDTEICQRLLYILLPKYPRFQLLLNFVADKRGKNGCASLLAQVFASLSAQCLQSAGF